MNILIIIGIAFAGGTIAVDHMVYELPHWLAIVLFTIAVIVIIAGMIKKPSNRKSMNNRKKTD